MREGGREREQEGKREGGKNRKGTERGKMLAAL